MILVSTLKAFALNTSFSVTCTSLVKQLMTMNTSFSLTFSSLMRTYTSLLRF